MLGHSVHLPVFWVLWLAFEHQLEDLHHVLVVFVLLNDICGLLDLKCGQLLRIHVGDLANRWEIELVIVVLLLGGTFVK